MLKIFLASHGKLASGVKSTVGILFGKADNLYCYDAYVDETSLPETLDEFFKTVEEEDQVVMLSDLYGGSVNTAMTQYLTRNNTFLVAGINVALVIELLTKTSVDEHELENIVSMSREMLRVVKVDLEEESTEEEFF